MFNERLRITPSHYAYDSYCLGKTQIPIWPLCLLIISFFYCLPLGRFSIGRFDSDFRVFDFAIFFAFSYYLVNGTVKKEFSRLLSTNRWFLKWLKVLSILIVISVFVSILYSGLSFILPRLIRTYRFISYLMVPFLVFAVVRNKSDFLILFKLFFWLCAIEGFIGFLQGLGVIPHFWPDYWRIMYAENDAPVATLSPHHKHMGVVMLVGVCLGIGYIINAKSFWFKVMLALTCLMMFSVPLFAGTRTYLLGFVGVIPAILLIGRAQALIPILLMVVGAFIFLEYSGDAISTRIENKFDERITERIEKFGYEGLYGERTIIYEDILRALNQHPQILLTGTGFQNIFRFVGANGAHNNYLQALMELGLLGLFVFVAFLGVLWKNLRAAGRLKDKEISGYAQYTWVALCGVLLTMFVGETFWGQAAMFTLAGQLSFIFGVTVSPLYWLNRYRDHYSIVVQRSLNYQSQTLDKTLHDSK